MKLKSLILGSVAAAGLSTAGFAADLGVLTSLDVCDALGISGLTISSDTNCLQISGGVSYEFRWGDFRAATPIGTVPDTGTETGLIDLYAAGFDPLLGEDFNNDWYSKVEAWLKFVGTASSDFGPASATIKIKQVEASRSTNEGQTYTLVGSGGWDDEPLAIDEAYVSIGDSTVIMAGKKSSIANFGDAQPFNYLRTFGYTETDTGVLFQDDEDEPFTGGHVIQIVSDLGNGVSVSAGLENLEGDYEAPAGLPDSDVATLVNERNVAAGAGTLVGVLAYAGEGITAHVTGLAIGVLDGEVDEFGVHAGATGTFDQFQVRGAVGYRSGDYTSTGGDEFDALHALLSAKATFDMFTVAASGEYMRAELNGVETDGFGFGGSVGATVTEGVSINLGARYFSHDLPGAVLDNDTVQVSAQIIAALTETIKVTAELGAYFNEDVLDPIGEDPLVYGGLELAWAPGGGFTSSIKGEANSQGGYRATFKAAKTFE